MSTSEKYMNMSAAFIVFLALLCLCVILLSIKLSRLNRDLSELASRRPKRRGT